MTEPQRDNVVDEDAEPMTTAVEEARLLATGTRAVPAVPADAIGRLVDRTVGRWVAPTFGLVSRMRGARSLHPDGRVYPAEVDVAPTAPIRPGRYAAAVRLSRGGGLPEPWPDALGLAIRLLDADGDGGVQDLLLASSSPTVVGRHLVLLARGYGNAFYSSVLPVRADGRRVILGARAVWAGPEQPLTHLDQVDRAAAAGLRGFDLLLAGTVSGWTPLGRVHLHAPAQPGDSRALRFNPYHQAACLAPVGMLNALRRRSYAASRRA